jgi:membrane-associated phospholipid phosphatase
MHRLAGFPPAGFFFVVWVTSKARALHPIHGNGAYYKRKNMPEGAYMLHFVSTLQAGWLGRLSGELLLFWRRRNAALPRARAWLFPEPWAWGLLAALGAGAAFWFAFFSSMHFVFDEDMRMTAIAVAVLFVAGLVNARRGSTYVAGVLLALAYFITVGVLGRVLNYLLMELGLPYQDALLDSFHHLVGFDWKAHVLWLNGHPRLMKLLELAYASYAWIIPLTILGLGFLGRFRRLREFLLLFSLTGFACITIGGLLPALGAYGHFGFSPAGLENIPATGTAYLSDMEAVRCGALGDFIVANATGLTTFPSFHTVMALLFAHAWRGTWLQWPMRAIALLTIMATPVLGGHYLIDLVGGAVVFAVVLKALDRLSTSVPHAHADVGRATPQMLG